MATNPYVNKVQKADGSVIIDISDTTAVASDVASGKNFYLATGEKVTGTASGGGGAISVVDTTDTAGGTIRTITALDISDTTAVASDVASGKYFYTADGTKTAGSASGGGGGPNDWLGAGTISIGEVFSETINLAEDTSYNDWTASTTAGTILAAPSGYQLEYAMSDIANYDYSLLTTIEANAAYKQGTTLLKIPKRYCLCSLTQWTMYCNTVTALESETPNTCTALTAYNKYYLRYYNSSGVDAISVSSIGPMYMTSINCSYKTSQGVYYLQWKQDAVQARCSSSYFDTTQKENIDADNTNMVIKCKLYKTPKTSHRETYDILADMLRD